MRSRDSCPSDYSRMRVGSSGPLPARGSCLAAPGAGLRVLGSAIAGDAFGLGPEGFAGGGEVRLLGHSEDAVVGQAGVEVASQDEAEVVGQVHGGIAEAVLA